jgi:hypothetical protein
METKDRGENEERRLSGEMIAVHSAAYTIRSISMAENELI